MAALFARARGDRSPVPRVAWSTLSAVLQSRPLNAGTAFGCYPERQFAPVACSVLRRSNDARVNDGFVLSVQYDI